MMLRSLNFTVLAVAASITMAAPVPALAQHHGGFRGHDIGHFGGHDMRAWQGGRWVHGWHGERFGWWWTFGAPWWYLYPTPVYPYPDPYVPPVVLGPPPAQASAAQTWYYCDSPAGYYPYVATCGSAWRPVPATPPAAR